MLQVTERIEADRKEFMRELEAQRQAFNIKLAERAEGFQKETNKLGGRLMRR